MECTTKNEFSDLFVTNMEIQRIRLHLSQIEMAKQLNISLSTYKNMISGQTTKFDLGTLRRLNDLTGLFFEELFGNSTKDMDLYHKIVNLSFSQKRFVEDIINLELDVAANLQQKEEIFSKNEVIEVLTPTGNMEDGMILDSCQIDSIDISKYRLKYDKPIHCGIRLVSNHMHPVYHRGDILLICKQPPRDGDTGIFINKISGRCFIRRYHQTIPVVLEPINHFGEPFFIDMEQDAEMNQWIKFGYVVTKIRDDI